MSNGTSSSQPVAETAEEQEAIRTYEALSDALTLVENALILARQGHERNPSDDERRSLDRQILDLEEQRARIDNKMTALIARNTVVAPPTNEQVAAIADLTGKVERQTNNAAAASMAIVVAGQVLELAQGINFG